jgi:hypothetical protein
LAGTVGPQWPGCGPGAGAVRGRGAAVSWGRAVVEVMLHDAARALATRRDIKDTSAAGNRYHNKRFVARAGEPGLRGPDVPEKVTGWSDCTLTGQAAYDAYADVAAGIDRAQLPFLVGLATPARPG